MHCCAVSKNNHKVEIIVEDTDTKDKTPFYLMSLIVA